MRWRGIREQWHAQSLLRYVLGQEEHHRISSDPLHEASNLPDLLGMRLVGSYTVVLLARHLPRVRHQDLLEMIGHDLTGPVDAQLLPDAAAAAFAVAALRGRDEDKVAARRAAVHAAKRVAADRIAELLHVGVPTIERLRAQPCEPAHVTAVLRQWRLRSAAAASARAPNAPARREASG
jgi:hypothetical protein